MATKLSTSFPFLLSLSFAFAFASLTSSTLTEPDTLLSFKTSLHDPSHSLSSWSPSSPDHHCNWTGIICSSSTTTVTAVNLRSLNLSGEISASICQLPSLTVLDLADNLFNQPIPLQLSACSSLEVLNLSGNLIWGTIPDQISEFQSLRELDLSRNHLEGRIPAAIGGLVKLRELNLGSNLLSGNVPNVFDDLTELISLDLSQNVYLVSEIPGGIGKLEKLERILLQSSGFHGEVPGSIMGIPSLVVLDLSQNNLSGKIGSLSLEKLVSFDVSQNRLVGSFPEGLCSAKGLINLSLHTNLFNGSFPAGSIDECSSLERFQVQNNGFSGDFPDGLWSLSKIKLIRAENNRFSGRIPASVSKAAQLEQVQIDNNSFTSEIPAALGAVKTLYRFSASLNGFHGELPSSFCDSPVMSIMNLSQNSLSGKIPELKNCRKLVSLSLAENGFTGEIPASLGNLPVLTYLDLSNNNLTGSIPQELQNLKLALFNVSYNRLSGRVPPALVSGLPASFTDGNPDLCGAGLARPCSDELPRGHNDGGLGAVACALITISFGFAILLVAAGIFAYHRSSHRKSQGKGWHSVFFYPLRVTEHDLIMAMNEKSAMGRGGAFGRVYAVALPSGELVAVKKLVNVGNQSSKSLKAEVKTLAKIRHKNIVKVLGFCHSEELIFLIYEYLEKRSLGDMIRRTDCQLRWSSRLRIAIGVAQGLAYLHKDYVPHLLHRNIKSNNILLDADCEPKLTDFCLDRVVGGEAAFQSTIASECASSCYNPPEHGYSKRATEQMDVYSYGVVLLELISGRQAEQECSGDEDFVDVLKWVRRKINIANGAVQVLDPKISNTSQQEMLAALDIAVRCTSVAPEKRPSMYEVVRALQSLSTRMAQIPETAEESDLPV